MSDEFVSRTGADNQSPDNPSAHHPSASDPPASDPPASDPPASEQPASDPPTREQPARTERRNVRIFLLGKPEEVEVTIAELHRKQFSAAGLWSKPLQFPETRNQFALKPGEVMRVYKHYLSR